VRPLITLLPLLLSACVQARGLGPDLGACSAPPSKVHTFGEVGIGTCLSTPVDLKFFQEGGTNWLAVSNADAFRNFDSGSLLLIDWDSLDLGQTVLTMDQLDAHAMPMDPYVGGLGYVSDPYKQVMLVAGRLSDGSRNRTSNDDLWVVDVSDPTDPQPYAGGERLTLKDDPQPVVVDSDHGRAFVGNITDHSISVLDTTGDGVSAIDVAPQAELSSSTFDDADGSGSTAQTSLTLLDATKVPNDHWTMSWVDGTYHIWVPVGAGGLQRWNYGGLDYHASPMGTELDPADSSSSVTEIRGPAYTSTFGLSEMLFSSGGNIFGVNQQASGYWDWTSLRYVLTGNTADGAWDALVDAPSVVRSPLGDLIFYAGRPDADSPASIGLATATNGVASSRFQNPVLAPSDPWVSFEDPSVRLDLLSQDYRMWYGMWDGSHWQIGLSESTDTLNWTDPTSVLAIDGEDVAAPDVVYSNGRYLVWYAHGDGTEWKIGEAWSYDGQTWYDAHDVLPVDGTYDPQRPPRAAALADATGGWRVRSDTTGPQVGAASDGGSYTVSTGGFSITPANGYEVSNHVLGDAAPNGILPGSYAVIGGHEYLYVTTMDASGRSGLAALERTGGDWTAAATDLIPAGTGGNDGGVESPVVVAGDGGDTLYYTAYESDGLGHLHRATSTDGLTWTAADIQVPALASFESVSRRPHSVEPLDGGGIRLWYTGYDGTLNRIGALTSDDGATFIADPGIDSAWQYGVGNVGDFDDSGVADPYVVVDGNTVHLWYAGFNGTTWGIGHATRALGETSWGRDKDFITGYNLSRLFGVAHPFSAAGVRDPVLVPAGDGTVEAFYAGNDTAVWRVGRAAGTLNRLIPTQRFPTVGDSLSFDTKRGDETGGVIELQQILDGFSTSGLGTSSMRLDPARGFLYVAAKRTITPANYIYVIDVRDDTRDGFVDRNYLDLEAVLEVSQSGYSSGFRDVATIPGTDLLYASGQVPDSLTVFDLSKLVDDDKKDVIQDAAIDTLPVRRIPVASQGRPIQTEDPGAQTQATISGADLAATPDGKTLLMADFRENSLIAYDLGLGTHGQEVQRTQYLGENPYVVRLSPDGKYAVVANYLGDVDDDGVTHSTLAIVDIDPTSPDYLQVVTWIKNR